uniref:Uncharacterized protein n=1 Tax=Nelumbo nucifera TaxID=4432 RepID=A0A822YEA0_NELNU|nr:TPA_asm: hypothetical protein HUJ06_030762 [Nelumbo nucifera]DAD29295.1 TPA_asm: hypothetical protein HUJ06_030763 [Nelumbo nucifera]
MMMCDIMNLPFDQLSWFVLAQWLKTCHYFAAIGFHMGRIVEHVVLLVHMFWKAGLGGSLLVFGQSLRDVCFRIEVVEAKLTKDTEKLEALMAECAC